MPLVITVQTDGPSNFDRPAPVCFPNTPMQFGAAAGDDPMCLDKQWQAWGDAWMSKAPPKVEGTGIAYMLKGDRGASNTDPFAAGPTATNNWVATPPHISVVTGVTSLASPLMKIGPRMPSSVLAAEPRLKTSLPAPPKRDAAMAVGQPG